MAAANSSVVPLSRAQHPLQLLTENSPNGKRVQILLEELRGAGGIDCETQLIDLETDEQKRPWFLALNPAGMLTDLPAFH